MIWLLLLDISGTAVTLQPTEHPKAIAEIVMDNQMNNGPLDEKNYMLSLDGLDVWVAFDWDRDEGSDALLVSPPDGVLCIPADCVLMVPEDKSGVLYLYEWDGM